MKIFFATDHAGFELKNELLSYLAEQGYEVEDCGAYALDESDDYPDYITRAAQMVAEDPLNRRAVILGGSGQGEAMCANRVRGVRAALYYGGNLDIVALSREHNDANVLSLGARFISPIEAKEALMKWLTTPFSDDERHKRRNEKLDQ